MVAKRATATSCRTSLFLAALFRSSSMCMAASAEMALTPLVYSAADSMRSPCFSSTSMVVLAMLPDILASLRVASNNGFISEARALVSRAWLPLAAFLPGKKSLNLLSLGGGAPWYSGLMLPSFRCALLPLSVARRIADERSSQKKHVSVPFVGWLGLLP